MQMLDGNTAALNEHETKVSKYETWCEENESTAYSNLRENADELVLNGELPLDEDIIEDWIQEHLDDELSKLYADEEPPHEW